MITAHASSGIDALYTALTTADAQLSRLSARLQTEFSLHHPERSTNPQALLHRLRVLQHDLPALLDSLQTLQHQKETLLTSCRTTLAENAALARRVLPVAAPRNTNLPKALADADSVLARVLKEFPPEEKLAADLVKSSQGVTEAEKGVEHVVEAENAVKAAPEKKVKQKKSVVVKSPRAEFVPVSKTVYNRLPRNLKIKAGKLPQINEFYQTVFAALSDASGPMSDSEIRNATGEKDMTKFEVLRGLAVLRHGKDGWLLAG